MIHFGHTSVISACSGASQEELKKTQLVIWDMLGFSFFYLQMFGTCHMGLYESNFLYILVPCVKIVKVVESELQLPSTTRITVW
jgi:hypothetical protein